MQVLICLNPTELAASKQRRESCNRPAQHTVGTRGWSRRHTQQQRCVLIWQAVRTWARADGRLPWRMWQHAHGLHRPAQPNGQGRFRPPARWPSRREQSGTPLVTGKQSSRCSPALRAQAGLAPVQTSMSFESWCRVDHTISTLRSDTKRVVSGESGTAGTASGMS